MTEDNKKANLLITFRFPDDSNFTDDVDSELFVQSEIAKTMHKLIEEERISHFLIGDDDVISEKLSKCNHEFTTYDVVLSNNQVIHIEALTFEEVKNLPLGKGIVIQNKRTAKDGTYTFPADFALVRFINAETKQLHLTTSHGDMFCYKLDGRSYGKNWWITKVI